MTENKKDTPQKILKLKFGTTNKEEKETSETTLDFKKNAVDQKKEQSNESDQKNFRGMPQIITTPSNIIDKTKPFRKKTFIPKNNTNENKFAIKKPIIKAKPTNFKPNFKPNFKNNPNNPIKKTPFDRPKFTTNFPSFVTSTFEKKSNVNNLNDSLKKKKTIKRESSKPKLTTFSNLIGNNFIGKIEASTLEYSEYYKVRKGKKNIVSNKSKPYLPKTIELETEISLKELASLLSIKLDEIEKQAKYIGCEENLINHGPIDIEILEMLATSLGHKVIRKDSINQKKYDVFNIKIDPNKAQKRAPVVAIVGHVDHGKTSLLDKIRKSNLTKSEVGGITQKIAAYSINTKYGAITFLDTPGHAAFINMRQRGIDINDITILVISAVEGIKEQTIEAIKQIKNSKTQLIIAATKYDLPNTNLDKIKQELTKYDVFVKDYGGETEIIEISSTTGHNIDLLLQTILAYSDIMELKANLKTNAIGIVLESKIDPKSGVLSTLLIQQGTLKTGDICSTLQTFGKIKGMKNDLGQIIREATPGMTVEALGFNECPIPGEKFAVLNHEFASELTKKSTTKDIEKEETPLKNLFAEEKPTLYLILNADTQGGLEALESSLSTINTTHSKYKIIKKSVGKIKDSDFDLAKLTNSIIVNYNLNIDKSIELKAKNEKILIISSKIIYELTQGVQEEVEKLITLIAEEVYVGTAVVKRLFKSSKIGNISGCIVKDGKILKGLIAKVLRKDELIFQGKIESLKRAKDDVKEVKNGFECGVFVNYKEIAEEDEILCYQVEYKKPD